MVVFRSSSSKFRNERTRVDGKEFASRKEAERYGELKLLERGGVISNLELQPRFALTANGVTCGHYIGDFRYIEKGITVVEDCKGMRLPLYILKRKLMKALYNIEIRET